MLNMKDDTVKPNAVKHYKKPVLVHAGSLSVLTQGFAGSVPDEQGGQTKRNPFQG
jgi:formyltetrahydrofolate synthetase